MPIEKNPLAYQSLVKFHQQKDSLSQSAKQKDSLSQSAKGFKKLTNNTRYAKTLLGVLAASSFATASASASVPALGLASVGSYVVGEADGLYVEGRGVGGDVHPTNKTQILESIFNKENCIADDYCQLFYNNIKLHPDASAVVEVNTDLPTSTPGIKILANVFTLLTIPPTDTHPIFIP